MVSISEYHKCPECGVPWKQEETITDSFLRDKEEGHYKDKTIEEVKEISAEMYGCTEDNPQHFGTEHFVGIQLEWNHPNHWDGVSYWKCLNCDTTWNRFTNLKEDIPENPNKSNNL
jgi:hypothetical protein